jgi:hypothetical protein
VWFQNAPDSPVIFIPLWLTFRDSRGNVYDTLFHLDVLRAHDTYAGYAIAPNVTITRKTTMTTARRLRWRARRNRCLLKLEGIPVVGRVASRALGWCTRSL